MMHPNKFIPKKTQQFHSKILEIMWTKYRKNSDQLGKYIKHDEI